MGHTVPSTNSQRKITSVSSANLFRKSLRYVKVKLSDFLCGYNCNRKPSDLFPVTLYPALYRALAFLLVVKLQNKKQTL